VAGVPFLGLDLALSHGHDSSHLELFVRSFRSISWPSCFDFLLGSAALHWLFLFLFFSFLFLYGSDPSF
jgi:hypothetical protein